MPKNDWVYVGHMLDMSQKALDLASDINKATYDRDETLKLALTHLLQVIGMRRRIVHDYLNVDEDVIWEVIQKDLPELARMLRNIIPSEYL